MTKTKFICSSISDIYDSSEVTKRVVFDVVTDDVDNKKIWSSKYIPRGNINLILLAQSGIIEFKIGDTFQIDFSKKNK